MIEEEIIKNRLDFLDARLDGVVCRMDEKLDATVYSPIASDLDMIKNEIEDLRMLLERLDAEIKHEQEQRKKFMIALVEAGEEGLL